MRENIGFIGAGNMAQALIGGWLSKDLIKPEEIFVSNRTPGKLKKMEEQFKVKTCATNEEVVDNSDIVVIAVKPQDFEAAIEPIASAFTNDQVVISLAAGRPLSKLKKILPQNPHLVRLMANTPARVNRGVFGYCTLATNIRVDRWMERMFSPMGLVVKLDEGELMHGRRRERGTRLALGPTVRIQDRRIRRARVLRPVDETRDVALRTGDANQLRLDEIG